MLKQMNLFEAVRSNDILNVALALQNGTNPGETDSHGQSPLFLAVRESSQEIVHLLIDHGTPEKDKNPYGNSMAVVCATMQGKAEILHRLAHKGYNINCTDNERQMTPLHYTAHFDNLNMFKLLLSLGANPHILDFQWKSLKEHALRRSSTKVFQYLEQRRNML